MNEFSESLFFFIKFCYLHFFSIFKCWKTLCTLSFLVLLQPSLHCTSQNILDSNISSIINPFYYFSLFTEPQQIQFKSSKRSHTWCFKWYCVCLEAAVCGSEHPNKSGQYRTRWDEEKRWNYGFYRMRVNACVCASRVHAVSAETQRQCGSVTLHSHGTCQAGSNVGQTPQGISSPVVCVSLSLSYWATKRGPTITCCGTTPTSQCVALYLAFRATVFTKGCP